MKLGSLITLLFASSHLFVTAQGPVIPDRFMVYLPEVTEVVNASDISGTVIQSFKDGECVAVETDDGIVYMLVTEAEKGFKSFCLSCESEVGWQGLESPPQFTPVHLGYGKHQWLVSWTSMDQRSGSEDGFESTQRGAQIWDLEAMTRLADLETFHDYQFYLVNIVLDSAAGQEEIVVKVVEDECWNLNLSFEKGKMIVSENTDGCNGGNDSENVGRQEVYELTSEGLVKKEK